MCGNCLVQGGDTFWKNLKSGPLWLLCTKWPRSLKVEARRWLWTGVTKPLPVSWIPRHYFFSLSFSNTACQLVYVLRLASHCSSRFPFRRFPTCQGLNFLIGGKGKHVVETILTVLKGKPLIETVLTVLSFNPFLRQWQAWFPPRLRSHDHCPTIRRENDYIIRQYRVGKLWSSLGDVH